MSVPVETKVACFVVWADVWVVRGISVVMRLMFTLWEEDKKVNSKPPEKEEAINSNEDYQINGQSGHIKIRENQNTQKAVTSLATVPIKSRCKDMLLL
eukprot:gene12385-13659_t